VIFPSWKQTDIPGIVFVPELAVSHCRCTDCSSLPYPSIHLSKEKIHRRGAEESNQLHSNNGGHNRFLNVPLSFGDDIPVMAIAGLAIGNDAPLYWKGEYDNDVLSLVAIYQ
jgi:hypothetical protein